MALLVSDTANGVHPTAGSRYRFPFVPKLSYGPVVAFFDGEITCLSDETDCKCLVAIHKVGGYDNKRL
jgi:hypothetical protein